jgi:hypothetical protein
VNTTAIDTAASSLEDRSYFIRKVGTDGFRIGYQPTMKKVVNDRRPRSMRRRRSNPPCAGWSKTSFRRGASLPLTTFRPMARRFGIPPSSPSFWPIPTLNGRAAQTEWNSERGAREVAPTSRGEGYY